MEVALTRITTDGFALVAEIDWSAEERWVIDTHNLYHHVIVDRTPPWYFTARRDAEHSRERAEAAGERFIWPWDVPEHVPQEWQLSVERALAQPVYAITFDTAADLAAFEPRLMGAFQQFSAFLRQYGSRPATVYRSF